MNGDFRRILKYFIKPLLNWIQSLKQAIHEIQWLGRRPGQITHYLSAPGEKKLNIGCGTNLLFGWLNVDFNPVSSKVIFLDATQPFPFGNNTFDCIFSEHMIEHVPYDQGLQMLRECHRVMKPGGWLRIDTPDMLKMISLYAVDKSKEQKSYIEWSTQKFSHSDEVRIPHECFVFNRVVREWGHQFIYDAWSLMNALTTVGFINCRQLSVGISDHPEFMNAEGHSDISGDAMNAFETLAIEAQKK